MQVRWMNIILVTMVVPGLDCRRCETDRGPFYSIQVGWTTKDWRQRDVSKLIDCRRRAQCQYASKLQLSSALTGPRQADLNLKST